MSTYKLLTILFYSCLGAATVLFILCIILFFKLDIRSAFAGRSAAGRMKHEQRRSEAAVPDAKAPLPEGAEYTAPLVPQEVPSADFDGSGQTMPLVPQDASAADPEGFEETAPLVPLVPPAADPEGFEETAPLVPQDAPAAFGGFTIVKKVVCIDTAETI